MSYQQKFVNQIKPLCFGVYKNFGILPSVCGGQACYESGYGRAIVGNNYFGIKWSPGMASTGSVGTNEYINGQLTGIQDSFSAYPNMASSFIHYGRTMNTPRYRSAVGMTDHFQQVSRINNSGYSTTPTAIYAGTTYRIAKDYGMIEWDKEALAGGDGGFTGDWSEFSSGFGGINLKEQFFTFENQFIKKNDYTRPGTKLKGVIGVVIRDAGGPGSSVAAMKKFLENKGGGIKDGGFHILIDDKESIATVPLSEAVYHSLSSDVSEFGKDPNLNTLSVGIIRDKKGKFSDKTLSRAIAVVAELANRYGFPTLLIKRGYDVDGRFSPSQWVDNQFDYSTFIKLVDYQRNQDTPLLNEDLKKKLEEQMNQESDFAGVGNEGLKGKPMMVPDGTAKKVIDLAFHLISYNMTYLMVHVPNIRPGGWCDCSSYTRYVYGKAAGIQFPRVAHDQARLGRRLPLSQTKPADLIFFYGPPSIGHVGIITRNNAEEMINSSVNFKKNTINVQRPRSPWWKIAWAQRVLSELDKPGSGMLDGSVEGGGGGGAPRPGSELEAGKAYAIKMKKNVNGYSSDNPSATSVITYGVGTTMRVLSEGMFAFRINDGNWIKKSDKESYELRATGKISNPIGEARTKNPVNVKTEPSHVAPNVIAIGGGVKQVSSEQVIPVYAINNGMALISDPSASQSEEWVTLSALRYTDFLPSYELDYADHVNDLGEKDSSEIPTLENPVSRRAKGFLMDELPLSAHLPGGMAVAISRDSKTLSLDSVIRLRVPTSPAYDGDYRVSAYLDSLSGEEIAILMPSNKDKVVFGTRVVDLEVVRR